MGNLQGQENSAKLAIQNNTIYLSDALLLLGDAYQKQGKLEDAECYVPEGVGIKTG
jgi:hypothetical protein